METIEYSLAIFYGMALALGAVGIAYSIYYLQNAVRLRRENQRKQKLFNDWFMANRDLLQDRADVFLATTTFNIIRSLNPHQSIEWCLDELSKSLRSKDDTDIGTDVESHSIH